MALLTLANVATSGAAVVAGSVGSIDLTGILDEVISLLPVVLPVVIGFIGIRKGISFLIGSLRNA